MDRIIWRDLTIHHDIGYSGMVANACKVFQHLGFVGNFVDGRFGGRGMRVFASQTGRGRGGINLVPRPFP